MTERDLSRRFDTLIVGAGSGGSVMASRLSEDPDRQVLLLESGPDEPADPRIAAAVRDGNQPAVVPGLNWNLLASIKGQTAAGGRPPAVFDYEGGRIVGGSSAVNATLALRGHPADYDEWAEALDCGPDWSWSAVLPYFRRLEDDPLGPDELHGRGGPMPIRREPVASLTPLQQGLLTACRAAGYPDTPDHNDPRTTGVGVFPKNVVDGVRMSTARTYLALARGRPNLTVLADTQVHRLLWEHGRCDGVAAEVDGHLLRLRADKVIVCAGAMNTPPILLRSGIGDPHRLAPLDIAVHCPLPGVGEGLMDHPVIGVWGIPKPAASRLGEPARQVLLRYTSGHSGHDNDTHICTMAGLDVAALFPKLAADAVSPTIAGLLCCFNRSTSRGYVRLRSADPRERPEVAINCLDERRDALPLKDGVRLIWDLLKQPELGGKFDRILAWTDGMVASDVALEQAVSAFVRPAAHLGGSARMGRSPERGAVVDPTGRVHGVDNLWVADASIMPMLPSAPPHLSCLMLAEKIAEGIRRLPS